MTISVVNDGIVNEINGELRTAILGCECCAFPLVDGIPVFLANDCTREALHALDANDLGRARQILLGLDDTSARAVSTLTDADREPTYRELLGIISDDAESDYFLYRFSDPTYRNADAIIRALTTHHNYNSGTAALDLCGGSGHLTRSLLARPQAGETVLADLYYWKLWIAARTTAVDCTAICCDASAPLPFTSRIFSTVVLSDAFPYIWHKRLCADEMTRIGTDDAIIVMPHLHNALGENISAGNTLTPSSYRQLFSQRPVRLFDDKVLLDEILKNATIDLVRNIEADALGRTPPDLEVRDTLIVNPLYDVSYDNGQSHLTRRFPTAEYGREYQALERYLPEQLDVSGDLRGPLTAKQVGIDYAELRRQRVLLDVPDQYY